MLDVEVEFRVRPLFGEESVSVDDSGRHGLDFVLVPARGAGDVDDGGDRLLAHEYRVTQYRPPCKVKKLPPWGAVRGR